MFKLFCMQCSKYSECLPPCRRLERIDKLHDKIQELAGDSEMDGLAKRTILEGLIAGNSEIPIER
jgi:hypothetical protein